MVMRTTMTITMANHLHTTSAYPDKDIALTLPRTPSHIIFLWSQPRASLRHLT